MAYKLNARQRFSQPLRAFFACSAIAAIAGCANISGIPRDPGSLRYDDKCYIENEQFVLADQLYSQYGSLQLVEQQLCNRYEWKRCEVNEALYRLRKVHDLP